MTATTTAGVVIFNQSQHVMCLFVAVTLQFTLGIQAHHIHNLTHSFSSIMSPILASASARRL